MTDTTQADVLVPAATPAKPARAPAPAQGYLFGPLFDFLMLGGGSVLLSLLIVLALPNGIPGPEEALMVTVLMIAINQPHFANSYQMFYRNFREKAFGSYPPALRIRYIVAGLVVPVALIAFLAGAAITSTPRVLGYGANLMFFLVGWHYVKQGYGILIVDSVQKRLTFSPGAKWILRANGYACWMAAWLGANHAVQKNDYLGLAWYTLPLPVAVYYAAVAAAVLTTLGAGAVLVQRWREAKGRLPWNGAIAYLTTLYLWVIFVQINPLVLAVIPTFHSLQYMAVVWRYQLNAGAKAEPKRPSLMSAFTPTGVLPKFAMFVGIGTFLGFLGFMGIPRVMDTLLPYDKHLFGGGLVMFCCYIFINVHHYFLDNVIWRRGNPDVQQHIFSRG